MLLKVLGISAAVIDVVGVIPYVVDILKGKTKPERVSFWIFLLLNSITFAAQAADGFSWATLLIGMSVLWTVTIAILSLKYGYGTVKRRDFISIIVALTGVVVWLTTNHPLVAVAMVIMVDVAAFWLTLVKSWEAPHTETLIAWLAGAVSASLAVFSVGKFEAIQSSYVLYSALANWALVFLLLYRRRLVKI